MKTEDSTIDMIYKLADAKMYEEKQLFYEKTGKHKRIQDMNYGKVRETK